MNARGPIESMARGASSLGVLVGRRHLGHVQGDAAVGCELRGGGGGDAALLARRRYIEEVFDLDLALATSRGGATLGWPFALRSLQLVV